VAWCSGPGSAVGVLATLRAPAAPLPPPFDRLTQREREVAAQLASGRDNQQIARALGLSPKTIRNTLSIVLAKLQVADRVQAALPRPRGRTVAATPA